jgi:hypothetical protein
VKAARASRKKQTTCPPPGTKALYGHNQPLAWMAMADITRNQVGL